jgi:hypothetical protein
MWRRAMVEFAVLSAVYCITRLCAPLTNRAIRLHDTNVRWRRSRCRRARRPLAMGRRAMVEFAVLFAIVNIARLCAPLAHRTIRLHQADTSQQIGSWGRRW